ncbi:hypothetical protein [Novosphingobium naphthalenivorans]|uniref:hypothetical protein n=1 Tax=Novosphingobium naphthalenivorans TaxID=273168 RepID=UPI000B30DE8E|nr:hypothetical protein [Novosphingobium naphthalenivorans]
MYNEKRYGRKARAVIVNMVSDSIAGIKKRGVDFEYLIKAYSSGVDSYCEILKFSKKHRVLILRKIGKLNDAVFLESVPEKQ